MKALRLVAPALLFVLVGAPARAGEAVTIRLHGDSSLTAEILSVRESSLVVTRHPGLPEESLRTSAAAVEVIPLSQIHRVTSGGRPGTGLGIDIGAGVGAAVGTGIAMASFQSGGGPSGNSAATLFFSPFGRLVGGAAAGALVGGLIGGLIGSKSVSGEVELDPADPSQRATLASLARYGDKEPDYLSARH